MTHGHALHDRDGVDAVLCLTHAEKKASVDTFRREQVDSVVTGDAAVVVTEYVGSESGGGLRSLAGAYERSSSSAIAERGGATQKRAMRARQLFSFSFVFLPATCLLTHPRQHGPRLVQRGARGYPIARGCDPQRCRGSESLNNYA